MEMSEYKVPVQSLIDHIKTAVNVDPWAKEMAERLLKEQEPVDPTLRYDTEFVWYVCGACEANIISTDKYCHECGRPVKWE